jgi:hypothetical protein
MFGHRHYVPVLRMKPAELRALRSLDPALRSWITPLLECPPRVLRGCDTLAALERRFDRLVDHIAQWAGRPIFIDFDMLRSTMPHAVEVMAAYAVRGGLRPIPVVSLKTGMQSTYAQSIHSTVERLGLGLCLRISPEELRSTGAAEMIERLLSHYHAEAESVDLVIDRGFLTSTCGVQSASWRGASQRISLALRQGRRTVSDDSNGSSGRSLAHSADTDLHLATTQFSTCFSESPLRCLTLARASDTPWRMSILCCAAREC